MAMPSSEESSAFFVTSPEPGKAWTRRSPAALFTDRNVHQTHKLHPILSLENIILLDISVIRV
jgi:hypothetical protein